VIPLGIVDTDSARLFHDAELIPPQWLNGEAAATRRVYNPAIVRYRDRLLMVYRVDFCRGAGRPGRVACAICRLEHDWHVVPGSVVPLSDTIVDGVGNHYDPRFLIFRDRLFVHYNNNWDTTPNQISLLELDADTLEARSPARPVHLDGPRQAIEKNWMFFEHDADLLAIYQIEPHCVLRVDVGERGPILCRPVYVTEWDASAYSQRYGRPRGGAPPVRIGPIYVSLFHSRKEPHPLPGASLATQVGTLKQTDWWRTTRRWLRERFAPVKYYGGVYAFDATPPFVPRFIHPHPVLRPDPEARRRWPAAAYLSPRMVVYPSGLLRLDDGRWVASYGVHDERCVVRSLVLPDELLCSAAAGNEARP
jgi:hypothetical protein